MLCLVPAIISPTSQTQKKYITGGLHKQMVMFDSPKNLLIESNDARNYGTNFALYQKSEKKLVPLNKLTDKITEFSLSGSPKIGESFRKGSDSSFNAKKKLGMSKSNHNYTLIAKDEKMKSAAASSSMLPDSSILILNNNKSSIIKLVVSHRTQPGIAEGKPKTNQDSLLFKISGLDINGFNLFSVMDGHGTHGHFISQSVKLLLSEFLYDPTNYNDNFNLESIYSKFTENNYSYLKQCFMFCETSIAKSKYDVSFSGTSVCLVVQIGDSIICANAGDSRAILCGTDSCITNLSNDHKPNSPAEQERIIASGGRVEKMNENGQYVGTYRVWLKSEDYPGLAMSRSLGDFVAKSIGCLCEPEVIEVKLTKASKFIIVASDGVWEFLSNKDVCKIIEPFYKAKDSEAASTHLIEESTKMWRVNEKDDMDDITCIVVFIYSSI